MRCDPCDTDMELYMPDDETWLTAQPPVRCPGCGKQDVAAIDPDDVAARLSLGRQMAKLVQAKRDGHHADHHDGKHAEPLGRFCHHCRDGHDEQIGSCRTCQESAA